jgi:DNA-binding LacI/PurR family transcriptional regulator
MTSSSGRHTVTIKDVAARAGVSWKTVTNVVHERPNVAATTRQRVLDAIDQLEYRPSVAGRHLRQGRTQTLTLVVPDMLNPYFAMLMTATFSAAGRRGYTIFLEHAGRGPLHERQAASSLLRVAFDGVIFHPTHATAAELTDLARHRPVVLVGENVPDTGLDRVSIDNAAAADDVTSHLTGLGRRTIAFVGNRVEPIEPSHLRLEGYRSALERADLTVRDELLVDTAEFDQAHGLAGAARLMDSHPDVDGIVCANDLIAIGVLRQLRQLGVRVPDDVAVTGWDNIPDSAYTAPTLTTIEAQVEEIAAHTVDLLLKRIEDPKRPAEDVTVKHDLVVRESSTPGASTTGHRCA